MLTFQIPKASCALRFICLATALVLAGTGVALSQTTSFTYQGRLTDGGAPANGTYEIQFTLWDATAGGTQQPQPAPIVITRSNVQVSAGAFTVQPLDFGAIAFPGADRYLEISVRRTALDPFTTLSPRQQITSTPYAIRSLTATTSTQLGGVDAARFVQSDGGGNVNIVGGLTVGGSFSLNTINAQTQYNLGGQRILANTGNSNLFVGAGAGTANAASFNTFVGNLAGNANSTGDANAFFGNTAGSRNTIGTNNSFFGAGAGVNNVNGSGNAFFGTLTGFSNTANDNSFFGALSGQNNTAGGSNSFFGNSSGQANVTGVFNAFFGASAGLRNGTGTENTFVGTGSGRENVAGSFNSFFGRSAGRNNTANSNSFFGKDAGLTNTTGSGNSFFGFSAGFSNTTSDFNAFFGAQTGFSNTTGKENSFFGDGAGAGNVTGSFNTFVGRQAGLSNVADGNSFFGHFAGQANTTGANNAFFGIRAGRFSNGTGNAFFGATAGNGTTTGISNSFFGFGAGFVNTTGSNNTFLGVAAGNGNLTGSNNTLVGTGANLGGDNLTNATALGASAVVSQNNSLVLGNNANVGIGTSTPTSKLTVVGLIETTTGGVKFPDGSIQTAAATSFNAILNQTTPQASANFNISGNGTIGGNLSVNGSINGNGSGLTTLSATNITTGTLANARLGLIPTANIADSAVTGLKIATGQVVKSLNGLNESVTLAAGSNITITPLGNTLTIASTSGSGILNQTTPQLSANFNIDGTGTADIFNAATQYNLQGQRFISMSSENSNTLVGNGAGNNVVAENSAPNNSLFGENAGLLTVSCCNSFFGGSAGVQNNSGSANVFVGFASGASNTTGIGNTFLGTFAGGSNITGTENSAIGYNSSSAAGISNATAIGARAQVTQSDSLVLGSINGVNGASADTNVGIGTSAPKAKLDVTGGNILIGTPGQGIVLKSPNGAQCKLLSIDNAGAMVLATIACP